VGLVLWGLHAHDASNTHARLQVTALAALFLAGKVEESPKKMKEFVHFARLVPGLQSRFATQVVRGRSLYQDAALATPYEGGFVHLCSLWTVMLDDHACMVCTGH